MRVCGVKEANFAAWVHDGSPRVFIRIGFQRYAATVEEAIELATLLAEAAKAIQEGPTRE